MADSIQPSLLTRLANTPFRDWIRGRLTQRLDWRGTIASAPLPDLTKSLILRIVKRTKLWRIEKTAVAEELIAHFLDGLTAGETEQNLITEFGDEKETAKLIRRAKIRNRSIGWHALKWARRIFALLVLFYLGAAAMFIFSRPSPTVDYLAELNRPVLAAPESDRAWPIYLESIRAIQVIDSKFKDGSPSSGFPKWVGQHLDGKYWPQAEKWLHANPAHLEHLRRAASKPSLGFVYGQLESIQEGQYAAEVMTKQRQLGPKGPLVNVLMPYLQPMRNIAQVLDADVKLAMQDRDGARVEQNITAMLNIAEQLRGRDFLMDSLLAIGVDAIAMNSIQRVLLNDPMLLSNQQWVRIAHQIAGPKVAADLISLRGERMFFMDMVQRVYSDDGKGDGHLTLEGFNTLKQWMTVTGVNNPKADTVLTFTLGPAVMLIASSRKDAVSTYDQFMNLGEANLHRPRREVDPKPLNDWILSIKGSDFARFRELLASILLPSMDRAGMVAEQMLGRREGVYVAIALELYRRAQGAYPEQLSQLVPTYLPDVPRDRITGSAIQYRLIEGRPALYSVGLDRVDDSGVPPMHQGEPNSNLAASWEASPATVYRGDWVVYPLPVSPPPADE